MIRPVCLRALALIPLALAEVAGSSAKAGPPLTPVAAPDPIRSSPGGPEPGSPDQSPIPPSPGASTAQGPTKPVETPAQAKYGLPRNPIVGGEVDIDLTKPLSLNRAIRIGLQRQNSIAIAKAQRDGNSQRVVQARASYFPQIVPSFNYVNDVSRAKITGNVSASVAAPRSDGGVPGVLPIGRSAGTGGTAYFNGSVLSESRTEVVGASYLLMDSGQRQANLALARRNLFASEYNLGAARQSVIEAVTSGYYALLRDRELVRVQQKNLDLAQATLDSINAEFQAGAAAQSDTLQAQSNLANARVQLLQAQNTAYLDEASLKNAMGVVTSQPLQLSDDTVASPDSKPDSRSLDDYVAQAYTTRLDLKQQQELVNAQGYSVKLAQLNAGLSVSATVNEAYQIDPIAGETRSFVVAVSYPLFDGFQSRAVVNENKAALEQQRRQLDADQQTVRLQVEQDYLTREVSRQQVVAADVAVKAGLVNYDAALEKQKNGLINILDVLNAQVQLLSAQVSHVNAIYNFYIADSALKHDIGVNDPEYLPNVPHVRQAGANGLGMNLDKGGVRVVSATTGTTSPGVATQERKP